MENKESELTALKSEQSSLEIPTLSKQLKNPENALRSSSNLSKYLILRELVALDDGVPSFVIADKLGVSEKLVATLLGNYRKWGLVEVVGVVKRPEGGRPFFLWRITDKGRDRFYYFHDKIMQGAEIGHRRRG